ncbi:MAG: dipicolinate synthase [Lachnospiraceae bacterium]|nr:dipicolinate synthase [Lachnospiraceae bacterium]
MKKFDFAIVGGDKRTAGMAQVFALRGYEVVCYGTAEAPSHEKIHYAQTLQEAVSKAPVIICGIPFAQNDALYFADKSIHVPLTELQRMLRKMHKIFGGVISEDFRRGCEKRGIGCYDFMLDEPLAIYNAIATAEGAILEALLHKDTHLHQSKTLVLGYGRCGRVLADKLKGLSAQVTVCSEQAQELATAQALGFQVMPLSKLPKSIRHFEYIFNTIPATVLTELPLRNMKADSLVIDIASNRVGVDYNAAEGLQRKVLFCPGLPGKYASLSCAENLADFVLNKL